MRLRPVARPPEAQIMQRQAAGSDHFGVAAPLAPREGGARACHENTQTVNSTHHTIFAPQQGLPDFKEERTCGAAAAQLLHTVLTIRAGLHGDPGAVRQVATGRGLGGKGRLSCPGLSGSAAPAAATCVARSSCSTNIAYVECHAQVLHRHTGCGNWMNAGSNLVFLQCLWRTWKHLQLAVCMAC